MFSEIILFGCILGFIIALLHELSSEQTEGTSQMLSLENEIAIITPKYRHTYTLWGSVIHTYAPAFHPIDFHPIEHHREGAIRRRVFYGRPHARRLQPIRKTTARFLVENWRKSIIGLVKLACTNLEYAGRHMESRDYKAAVQAASTSVENIARALIHCYGDKPNPSSGQEEVLRMLCRRFEGDAKIEFEKAIENVARIDYNKSVLRYLSTHEVQLSDDEANTKRILESASKIVSLFKHIIIEYFGEEISELLSTRAESDTTLMN